MTAFQQQLAKAYETLKQAKWVNLSHQIDANSPHFPALPALEQKRFIYIERWIPRPTNISRDTIRYTYRPSLPLL